MPKKARHQLRPLPNRIATRSPRPSECAQLLREAFRPGNWGARHNDRCRLSRELCPNSRRGESSVASLNLKDPAGIVDEHSLDLIAGDASLLECWNDVSM